MFLYEEVGYEKIQSLAPTLFVRPYAATSLREYFATAFEEYYLKGEASIRDVSPQVYKKLKGFEKGFDFKPQVDDDKEEK